MQTEFNFTNPICRNSFHNSTFETGKELQSCIKDAKEKDNMVLQYFKAHPNEEFTPIAVFKALSPCGINILLTSVRRAITNLEDSGDLVKTGNKVKEMYGRFNYTWRYNNKENNE